MGILEPIQQLHWADKAGLLTATIVAAGAGLLSLVAIAAVASPFFWRFDLTLMSWSLVLVGTIALPLWLGLRAIDAALHALRRVRRTSGAKRDSGFAPDRLKARIGWQ